MERLKKTQKKQTSGLLNIKAKICRVLPTTEAEFLTVSGVGTNKLEKYGDAFLRVIRKYKPDKKGRKPFAIKPEKLNDFEYFDEPISVSKIAARINELNRDEIRQKLKATDITQWLLDNDYLKATKINGKKYKLPTLKGKELGLTSETRVNEDGDWYKIVLYDRTAQEFVIENIIKVVCG